MKINTALLKSDEFIAWIAINAIFPTFMIGLIWLIDTAMVLNLSTLVNNIIVIFSALLMLFANISYTRRWRNTPVFKYFASIIFLNIAAFFVVGSISFVTAFAYLNISSDTFIIHYGLFLEAQKFWNLY